jgi:hypothetical protein
MVGFSGAVEDGIRNRGMVVSAIVALALGYVYRSAIVGIGAFVAGSLIASLWANHAGERFRHRNRPPPGAASEAPDGEGDPPKT